MGVRMLPLTAPDTATNRALLLQEGSIVKYDDLYSYFGHICEQQLRDTAKQMGITISGKPTYCKSCMISKARQKNLNKVPNEDKLSTTPGERLYFDISSVTQPSIGGNKFWLLIVDDATDMPWSIFLKCKSDLSQNMFAFLKTLIGQGYKVKFLRCDSAGENTKFKADVEKDGLNVEFEFTAPRTPQHNGKVERKFATLYGRLRAMLDEAGLDAKKKAHYGLMLLILLPNWTV